MPPLLLPCRLPAAARHPIHAFIIHVHVSYCSCQKPPQQQPTISQFHDSIKVKNELSGNMMMMLWLLLLFSGDDIIVSPSGIALLLDSGSPMKTRTDCD